MTSDNKKYNRLLILAVVMDIIVIVMITLSAITSEQRRRELRQDVFHEINRLDQLHTEITKGKQQP